MAEDEIPYNPRIQESESSRYRDLARIFDRQRAESARLRSSTAADRIETLRRLRSAIEKRAPDLRGAVHADFRKAPDETTLTEIFPVTTEIEHACRHLKRWMKPERIAASFSFPFSRSEIRREPRGVCLILSPWNFPFQLAAGPLVSAVAAGNCAIVKPSELAPRTSRFLAELIRDVFDEAHVAVVEGDASVAQNLLEFPFDHIFFTGSTSVGKIVMSAAAKNLASVTLELGGKSPAILAGDADLRLAARRIVWGKFINAGQTCVAPDYALVPAAREAQFVSELRAALRRSYGPAEKIAGNADYCRIVDSRHFARIARLLEESVAAGARVAEGGVLDEKENFISPTILTRVASGSPIMREEIFGPVLPILAYDSEHEAVAIANAFGRPLAAYFFCSDQRWAKDLLSKIPAGDTVINDVVVHFVNPRLPFGGINQSGFGKGHGRAGFLSFSHERAVMRQPRRSPLDFLHPPYTPRVRKLIHLVVRYFSGR